MKNVLIIVGALVIIGLIALFVYTQSKPTVVVEDTTPEKTEVREETPVTPPSNTVATPTPAVTAAPSTIIGSSYGDRDIVAYHFGTGAKEVLFVGGIHGGYSWNTSLVAYELMTYLKENPNAIPEGLTVTVIPVLNPDGLMKTVGKTESFTKADVPASVDATIPGRFNGNNVDLNRNFDCEWQASGTWQNRTVSGGGKAFSEPESQALRDYVTAHTPVAAVVWYSSAGGVYSSNCKNGVLPETKTITNLYAQASGYPAYETFNYYEITGDAVNWMAKMNIPAISVLLTTHDSTEWDKNKKGIDALLAHYAE